VQLTSPEFLRAPSIYARMAEVGATVLAVTTKNKLRALLGNGGVRTFSAELAHEQELENRLLKSQAVMAQQQTDSFLNLAMSQVLNLRRWNYPWHEFTIGAVGNILLLLSGLITAIARRGFLSAW